MRLRLATEITREQDELERTMGGGLGESGVAIHYDAAVTVLCVEELTACEFLVLVVELLGREGVCGDGLCGEAEGVGAHLGI